MDRVLELLEPVRVYGAKITRIDFDSDQCRWSRFSFWTRVENEIVVAIGCVIIPSQSAFKCYRPSVGLPPIQMTGIDQVAIRTGDAEEPGRPLIRKVHAHRVSITGLDTNPTSVRERSGGLFFEKAPRAGSWIPGLIVSAMLVSFETPAPLGVERESIKIVPSRDQIKPTNLFGGPRAVTGRALSRSCAGVERDEDDKFQDKRLHGQTHLGIN